MSSYECQHSSFSTGKIRNGENVSGSISVPEVAHDTEEDEYVVCSLCSSPELN